MLPETNYFQVLKSERETREAQRTASGAKQVTDMKAFLRDANTAFRQNWVLFVYMVILMSGYNSVSHGSQDLYPTFLKTQVGMGATQVTVVTVVGQIGALIGSTTIGYCSSKWITASHRL